MNIDDFLKTVLFSLSAGLLIGFFLRDIAYWFNRLYKKHFRQPKHLEQYHFDEND